MSESNTVSDYHSVAEFSTSQSNFKNSGDKPENLEKVMDEFC